MHEYERLEAYQVKKNLKKLEEILRKKIGVSERGLGDEKTEVSKERSTEMSYESHEKNIQAISKSRQMKVSRGIEQSIKVGVKKKAIDRCRCQACVEEQITISRIEARSIDLVIGKLSRRQELSQLIHQLSRRCQDCDKKKSLEARQIARCGASFKNSFQRREKHRYECNQTCNITNDPNTI